MPLTIAAQLDSGLSYIPTGVSQYDNMLGGGIALGKVTVISGQPSMGKSTLAYSTIAEAQKMGITPVLYDVEYAYDSEYAKSVGVDPENLYVIRAEFAEEGLDMALEVIKKGDCKLIVIDSVGALLPRAAAEKSIGEKTIGGQASLMAQFIRRAVPLLATRDVGLVCLTHEFTDIMTTKVMPSGGAKLMYHASVHIRLKQKFGAVLKSGDKKIGKVIIAEVKKNKLNASESREAEAQFIYGEAFSKAADLLETALARGIITKAGNMHYFKGEKIGLISKVRLALKDPEFAREIEETLA